MCWTPSLQRGKWCLYMGGFLSQQSNSVVAAAPVPARLAAVFTPVATIRCSPFFLSTTTLPSLPSQTVSASPHTFLHHFGRSCRHNPSISWRGTLTNHPPDFADKNMALPKQPHRHRSSSDPFSDPPTISYSSYGVPTLSRNAPNQQHARAPPVPPKIPSKASANTRSYPKQAMATEVTTVPRHSEQGSRTRVGRSQTQAPVCVTQYLQPSLD